METIITLHTNGPKGTLDLALPEDVPVRDLLPELVRAVGLPVYDRNTGRPVDYGLEVVSSSRPHVLHDHETLSRAGVCTGCVLTLRPVTARPALTPRHKPLPNRGLKSGAVLRCESGRVVRLESYGKPELAVGRYDPRTGQKPDIELSNEPSGDTVSRAHALLRLQGQQWVLTPLSTRSPTLVDGKPVPPQHACPLHSGQVITLGLTKLLFRAW